MKKRMKAEKKATTKQSSPSNGEKKTRRLVLVLSNQRFKWFLLPFSFLPLITFLYANQSFPLLFLDSWQMSLLLFGFPAVALAICLLPLCLPHIHLPKIAFPKTQRKTRRETVVEVPTASFVCPEKRFVGYLSSWSKPSYPSACLKCGQFLNCTENPKHKNKKLKNILFLAFALPLAVAVAWFVFNKILMLI